MIVTGASPLGPALAPPSVVSPFVEHAAGVSDRWADGWSPAPVSLPDEHAVATSAATVTTIKNRLMSFLLACALRPTDSYRNPSTPVRSREQTILRRIERQGHRAHQLGILAQGRDLDPWAERRKRTQLPLERLAQ